MKKFLIVIMSVFFIFACGGGNNNDSGTAAFSITDSKPKLPDNVTSVIVTIDEITVHSNKGNWIPLILKETPFVVDLLEYTDGKTTQIVPPIFLPEGTYTQLRMSVKEAYLRVTNPDNTTEDFPVEVPSDNLKTDTPFTVELSSKGYIDMVIDFDLSQSLVVTGGKSPKYKLKPVLHIVKINDAVIFEGVILNTLFVEGINPVVTVLDKDGTIYTQVVVEKEPEPQIDSQWEVFWIVPNENYTVNIDYNGDSVIDFTKEVLAESIPPGTTLKIE
jgi:hypothetical protein